MSGDIRSELKHYILQRIKDDPLAADLQWSLFVSALQSYRFDTVLRPFPPMFLKNGSEKDMKSLEHAVEDVPRFLRISSSLSSMSEQTLSLLKWVLDPKGFTLKTLDRSEFSAIQKKTEHVTEVPVPHFIFEVLPSETNDNKFQQLRQDRDVFFAYHGSRVENFHSILHNGLASHMNKISMFGEGTYLSGELAVSMTYSPTGLAWNKSELGSKLGCIAVCEMIDHPSVKCQSLQGSENGTSKSRARVEDSMAGDVPEKYYVVRNNEMIRIKYLLLYAEKTQHHATVPGKVSWFHQNKFAVTMVLYVLILLAIGLANSKSFQFHMRKMFK